MTKILLTLESHTYAKCMHAKKSVLILKRLQYYLIAHNSLSSSSSSSLRLRRSVRMLFLLRHGKKLAPFIFFHRYLSNSSFSELVFEPVPNLNQT